MKFLTVYSKLTLAFLLLSFMNTSTAAITEIGSIIKSDTNHSIKILTHGLASLKERLDLIESAKKTIDVEYFIFNADESGKIFISALMKKQREGVQVRILLDSMLGKSEINPFIAEQLIKKGIQIKYFNELSLFKGVNNKFRNHRKLLVIDNLVAMTGGRNIGNEYFDLSKKFNFFDREIVISGEIVNNLTISFDQVWNSKWSITPKARRVVHNIGGKNSNSSEYYRYIQNLKDAETFLNDELDNSYLEAVLTVGQRENEKSFTTSCQDLSFITEKPIADKKVRSQRVINEYLVEKIKVAKEKIIIETPYFTFSDFDEEALGSALSKNVEISLLTNGANSTDVKISAAAVDQLLRNWLAKGISFALFKGEKLDDYEVSNKLSDESTLGLHAKTYIFDDRDIVIGTYNFDFFSAKYNGELLVECSNAPKEFLEHVKLDIEKRKAKSFKVETEQDIDEFADNSVIYTIVKALTRALYDGAVN